MDEIDEIVRKWRNLFIWETYIDETIDEVALALKMEFMARHIISLPYNEPNQQKTDVESLIETSIFPIIFRIIKNGGIIGDVGDFYDEVLTFYYNNIQSIRETQMIYNGIDIEAELCSIFCENYVYTHKNEFKPIKFITKHRIKWMK
tara:strand:- start:2943 stop:3383 length:441 start_codon:yes stop_codon:yes gene_type:complete